MKKTGKLNKLKEDKLKKGLTSQPGNHKAENLKAGDLKEGQPVELIIGKSTDLGYKAVIDNHTWGVLYHTEIFQKLYEGQKIKGFVKKVRDDGKIDFCLQKPGYEKIADISEQIIQAIAVQGGYIEVTDKSSAEQIYELFGISKKNFKKAIGALYKAHRIIFEKEGISLS